MLVAEIDAVHQRVWQAVCHYWEPNKIHGHGPDHAMRVYSMGLQLAAAERADPLVVGAGCYLHDAGLRPDVGRTGHIERSLQIASALCEEMPELANVRDLILTAIRYHEAEIEFPAELPMEAVCVRDSDTVDRLGFTGIRMTLQYGIWMGRALCHPTDPLCREREPDLNRFTMDYVCYLESLPQLLMTPVARGRSKEKQEQREFYCSEFQSSFRQGRMRDHQDALQLVTVCMREESHVA
ncbi:MAG TPA: HD domain-containing protein [Terriglobales bacterium]|nr:HD domain-containing protein [Terriglobales bacterium]